MNQYFKTLFIAFVLFVTSVGKAQMNDEVGGVLLTKTQVEQLFPDEVLKQIGIQLPIFRVYSFEDKKGKHYLILTENLTKGKINDENSLKKSIKAFNVYRSENQQFKTEWTITDFINEREESIWFWTKYLNLKDLDNDGLADPIVVYGTRAIDTEDYGESRMKILIYHRGEKIAIRHQNSTLDYERHTQIDQKFYQLPVGIKKKVDEIIGLLMENWHSIFDAEVTDKIEKSLEK